MAYPDYAGREWNTPLARQGRDHLPGERPTREELMQLLGSSHFHEWSAWRRLVRDVEAFDSAAATIRGGWSHDEVTEHLKAAIVALSTEAVQIIPRWSGARVEAAHLDLAKDAFDATASLVAQLQGTAAAPAGVGPRHDAHQ